MTHSLTTEDGLSTLALTNLPLTHRKLIRLILRQVEPTYADLCQAVATWAANEQMRPAELEAALKILVEQHYLVELGHEGEKRYKVSFSRRASRELTQNLWENVGTAPLVEKPSVAERSAAKNLPPLAPPTDPATET